MVFFNGLRGFLNLRNGQRRFYWGFRPAKRQRGPKKGQKWCFSRFFVKIVKIGQIDFEIFEDFGPRMTEFDEIQLKMKFRQGILSDWNIGSTEDDL